MNIVLSGLKLSLADDAEIVKNLFHDDLHIDTTVTRFVRVGQAQPDRPELLIATLASTMAGPIRTKNFSSEQKISD